MLTGLIRVGEVVVLSLACYTLLTALAGWPTPAPPPTGARNRRLVVVVPAHDEERVIGGIVSDLMRQDYPTDCHEVWVLADRCSDGTAEAARGLGARVMERTDGPPGKGQLLGWFLERRGLAPGEVLVVFDADNRIAPATLGQISDVCDAGHRVVQCYLDVSNPDASPLALASALSYWAGNRMVQLSRSNLGWSADLGGTGMAFEESVLGEVGAFGASNVEDNELALRLALAGIPIYWAHHIRILDEKPVAARVAVRQRARWKAGKRELRARYLSRLGKKWLERPSMATLDQMIRLVNPGRSLVALVSAIVWVGAVIGPGWFFSWRLWATATLVQLLTPIPFLLRDRIPLRHVVRFPILVLLPALAIPIGVASRRIRGWYHTPHVGGLGSGTER